MPHLWRFRQSRVVLRAWLLLLACGLAFTADTGFAQTREARSQIALSKQFSESTLLQLQKYCLSCHSSQKREGELDLEQFSSLAEMRKSHDVWSKVIEMLENGEMPPKDFEPQPTPDERKSLRQFVDDFLYAEALADAGDPGPVVLRRLSNAEYTYVIRDLTRANLSPAREFPADGAAGEGFTNAGAALVMSPALLEKYIDAGKEVAAHAVLLPHGFRFSDSANHQDHVNEILARIRKLYRANSDSIGASQVNLQGIVFDTNDGGRLALEKYIAATITHRERLAKDAKEISTVARDLSLNAKYLGILYHTLSNKTPSRLLAPIIAKWRNATIADAPTITAEIDTWRNSLWKFSSIGHIGKLNGPTAWQEPVSPLAGSADIRLGFDGVKTDETTLYISAGDAGDGPEGDHVLIEEPRFVVAGKPDILLRDLRAVCDQRIAQRDFILANAEKCLNAAAEALDSQMQDVDELATKHGVNAEVLKAWFAYLGVGEGQIFKIESPMMGELEKVGGYDFVSGWGSPETPSALANGSEMHVRVPANLPGKSVLVHPSPTLNIVSTFQSPISGSFKISATARHAHPECGNGVIWSLEVRHGASRRVLSNGVAHGDRVNAVGPFESIRLAKGDLVSLVIGPRDANHSCDSTLVELTLTNSDKTWSLASDVAPNIQAGNPHADSFGNADVWCFHTEPVGAAAGYVIPEGSLLANWQASDLRATRNSLAIKIAALVLGKSPPSDDSPDGKLYRQLTSLGGPLLSAAPFDATKVPPPSAVSTWGLDPSQFGMAPAGGSIGASNLVVDAPKVLEIRIPTDLIAGRDFMARATLLPSASGQGSAQVYASLHKPSSADSVAPGAPKELNADSSWTTRSRQLVHSAPILVQPGSIAEIEWSKALDGFRSVFPQALCYTKIVPVDEVVTLTLYHREDEALQRLMLRDDQIAELDRLWEELHFVARDALTLVDAFQQLLEYASQDGDPKVFAPLKEPIHKRAENFKAALLAAESTHLDQAVQFASGAYRRPLASGEADSIRELYRTLRTEELPHDDAIRFLIARILASPTFLYKVEPAPAGDKSSRISNIELANRLSFFLWSSMPDDSLRAAANQATLSKDSVLRGEAQRMLKDPRIRRFATEFACQWLHIYEFDQHDEKSEKHFPEFAGLRADMYEEAIQFFTDMAQNDRSILSVLDADHTFVNSRLAEFYGVKSDETWHRIDGARQFGRGGVLAMAATLSKQSGASRTSPILRGNWVSEVLLGERLPRPPKDVPQLPEEESTDGLTVRQLIEKHSSDSRCATCHVKIDPFGFALEKYDAIGRFREADAGKRSIDVKTKAPDGTPMEGVDDLREYLLTHRKDAFVRQFCRKLLGYALGRGVQLSDEPLIQEMMASLAKQEYRFSAAIEPIIQSRQFREIRGRDAVVADTH